VPDPHDPKAAAAGSAFHVQDDDVDLSEVTLEGWLSLGFFLLLGATVFYQFLTRYVLNDSAAWTEEIARYLLISTVFLGLGIGVAKHSHIHVDFFYRFLPMPIPRWLARVVDIASMVFYGACVVLTGLMMQKMGSYQMTIVNLPMNIVYGFCLLGFAIATWRAFQIMVRHWREDYRGVDVI
jgi:TRAP-type C4-dicarboxylate transport system permease small subunit